MATYVGFQHRRASSVRVVATIGLVTPSVIVILIVAAVPASASGTADVVSSVFYGLRPASAAMVAAAGLVRGGSGPA